MVVVHTKGSLERMTKPEGNWPCITDQDEVSNSIDNLVNEIKPVNANFQRLQVDISVVRNMYGMLANKIFRHKECQWHV